MKRGRLPAATVNLGRVRGDTELAAAIAATRPAPSPAEIAQAVQVLRSIGVPAALMMALDHWLAEQRQEAG